MKEIIDAINSYKVITNKDAQYLWLSEEYFNKLTEKEMEDILSMCSSKCYKLELKIKNTLKDGFSIG